MSVVTFSWSACRRLAAVVRVAALAVGLLFVPVGLAVIAGVPWPVTALTVTGVAGAVRARSAAGSTLVRLMAVVAWLAWLWLTISVVAQLSRRALRRVSGAAGGAGIPDGAPLGRVIADGSRLGSDLVTDLGIDRPCDVGSTLGAAGARVATVRFGDWTIGPRRLGRGAPVAADRRGAACGSCGLLGALDVRTLTARPVVVEFGPDGVEVLWDRPQLATPPAGWTARDSGWAWRLRDASAGVAPLVSAIPGLVSVGWREHRRLLVDLEAAGTLTVDGPDRRVGPFIDALMAELAGRGVEVLDVTASSAGGDRTGLTAAIERIRVVSTEVERSLDEVSAADTFGMRAGLGLSPRLLVVHVRVSASSGWPALRPRCGVAVAVTGGRSEAGAPAVVLGDDGSGRLEPWGIEFTAEPGKGDVDGVRAATTRLSRRPGGRTGWVFVDRTREQGSSHRDTASTVEHGAAHRAHGDRAAAKVARRRPGHPPRSRGRFGGGVRQPDRRVVGPGLGGALGPRTSRFEAA